MTANRPRPHIPDSVKAQVVIRQMIPRLPNLAPVVRRDNETMRAYLDRILSLLAFRLGCERNELHLDHDPPLRVRAYNARIKDVSARYWPSANDPNYLIYRTDVEHRLKTNVRGDGAQHPDRVLIKKQRRHERGPKPKRSTWAKGRKIQSANRWPKKEKRR